MGLEELFPEGVILQKGAFNPLHRMHERIAKDVQERFPDYPHCFLLSYDQCDKGRISEKEMEERLSAIRESGHEANATESGLFIENIKEVRKLVGDIRIVFPAGEDTIYRFFRDWYNHYGEFGTGEEAYQKMFQNVIWYLTKRDCPEKAQYEWIVKHFMQFHNNIIWSDLDLDSISSSQIREEAKQRAIGYMRLKEGYKEKNG